MRKGDADSRRSLPVVKAVPLRCAATIVDLREPGVVPTRERRREIYGPFLARHLSSLTNRRERPILEEGVGRRNVGPFLGGNIINYTNCTGSPQHALGPSQ